MILQKAERKNAKIKMALQGPSGSGKTYSALLLAFGLCNDWSKIAVIDTENHSSDLYAHLGQYNVLPISEPFTPEKYIDAIKLCEAEGIQVIIIDSISHEWEGSGGILDIHSNMAGNSFTNWSKVTPRHNSFINAIIQSSSHIIGTIRTKQDYVLSDKNGKMVPEKVGLKGVTRDGVDYEFTLVFDIDIKHVATASKDRTGLFMDKLAHVITTNDGIRIRQWCGGGNLENQILSEIDMCKSLDELRNIYLKYPEHQRKLNEKFFNKKEALQASVNNTSQPNFKSNGRAD
jgi:hypothetical protein